MNKRTALLQRKTSETEIEISINLDGEGKYNGSSGIGFFDHALTLFSKNSLFDINLKMTGDLGVDEHHTVEDIGIILGTAARQALGDKRGIARYGFFILPMDEALATGAIDLSGRYYFRLECDFKREKVGDLPTELVYDFWESFAQNAQMNLQIKVENNRNDHHAIESIFKCVGRALRMACAGDEKIKNTVPSTKGAL